MIEVAKEILKRASENDRDAFKEVYNVSAGYVYSIALRMIGNTEDAQEVTQDVFLKVHHNLKRFEFRSAFSTWLYRITVNTTLSRMKKYQREKPKPDEFQYLIEKTQVPSLLEKRIEKEDQDEKVCHLMSFLNLDQRACLLLRAVEGMDYKGIAEVLEVNINTVRTRLKRAREILVRNLRKEVKTNEL